MALSIWAERLPGRKDSQVRRAPYQGEQNLSRFQPSPPTRLCFPSLRIVCCRSPTGVGKRGWEPRAQREGTTPRLC